jgi:hypothetical protein
VTLREKQSRFALCLGKLIAFVYAKGWELTMSEGYVGDTDAADKDYDGPHKSGGTHYMRIGQDLNLWIAGEWISSGSHPAWRELGAYWKGLDGDARWGGDFSRADPNHFSFTHNGRS